jgi:hypothetical protein
LIKEDSTRSSIKEIVFQELVTGGWILVREKPSPDATDTDTQTNTQNEIRQTVRKAKEDPGRRGEYVIQ